jgi:hypothetical protein
VLDDRGWLDDFRAIVPEGQVPEWLDEANAPPLDLPRLKLYAEQVIRIVQQFEYHKDGGPMMESFDRIYAREDSISEAEASHFDRLIAGYKSWALAWHDLTADFFYCKERTRKQRKDSSGSKSPSD